jgi:superfamily II DNA or RNA helicase
LEDFLRQHNKKPDMSLVIPDEQLAKEEMVYSMTEVTCAFYYHRWSTIIIDEGHELRNEKSNAFTAISQLSAHFKIIATADPFNNSIQDIVSLFMICGIPPGVDTRPSSKDNRRTCVHDYCALLPKDAPCAIEIHGAVPGTTLQKRAEFSDNVTTVIKQWNVLTKHQSMVDELCKALTLCRDSYMIQQDKNVLRDHYKPTTIVINPDFVSSEERGLYDFIRSKDSVLVKKTTGTKLSAFSRSRHACSGLYHTEDLNAYFETNDSTHRDCFSSYDEKHSVYFLPTMILAIDSYIHIPLKRGEKTIIFADFQQSVVEIVNHLKRTNPHISIFSADAKVQTSQRDEILRNFETSRGPAILVTTRVFSQGVNIECANHVILADVWWNFVTTDQSESRVSRPSQKKSVFIVKIIIRNSVEELMWAVSERKRKISSQVLKGPITPSLVRKITTLNTVDTFKSNMLLIEDLVPSSSCPSSSSSSSSSLFSMDNPALFQILRQMLEKSADVYVKTTVELRSDPSLIPPTVLLTPFISMIPRTPSSSSSSSSSLSTKQFPRTGFTPVQKLSSANTMIKGNYHYRRFTPLRTSDNPYQKLISRPQQSSQKRQIIEIDDSGNIIGKKSRLN